MDRLFLYHALSDDDFDINKLFRANIIKTYKKIIIISGGKKKETGVSVYLIEDDELNSLSE